MKVCRRCEVERSLTEFRADPRYRGGYASWCRECHRQRNSEWARENRERLTAKSAEWRAANPEKWREINIGFKRRNAERLKAEHAEWAKENRGKRNATTAKYRAAKLRATPPWADQDAIRAIYEQAAKLQHETGVRMHVDHIVPLQHEAVCGLHCEANLQILPGALNEAKRNKWSLEDAQRQGDMFIDGVAA